MTKNPIVRFVEFCGKHPFATGLLALISVISFAFGIFAYLDSSRDAADIQRSVDSVSSVVTARCASPPCWTPKDAIQNTLNSTKDYIDSKIGVSSARGSTGWRYKVEECWINVHYVDDVAVYVSHQLSSACPFSWEKRFWIERPMPLPDEVTVNNILREVFAGDYPPELHMATGCTNCGNHHEPYIEFRIPGPHVADWYDRYFTIDFSAPGTSDPYENTKAYASSLELATGMNPIGTMEEFCGVDVRKSVAETLGHLPVTSVGYGVGGWQGRTGYKIDICNEGYVAR